MRAVQYYRSLPRYVASRALAGRLPAVGAGSAAPLRYVTTGPPELPGAGWARVRPRLSGICGSDLATVTGRSSFYFSPLVSMPFVPGHEVVGELLDPVTSSGGEHLDVGARVVLNPLLCCAPRGLDDCAACAAGRHDRCDRITVGHLAPGLQTGFCADTGGGWSEQLVAHASQLHGVPDTLPDERAVLVEPLACAVHTALVAGVRAGDRVLVIGAGAVGLFTLLALRAYTSAAEVTVVAKHPKQSELAHRYGATEVVSPRETTGRLRRATRALRQDPERGAPYLLGGVDVAIDCVGSPSALDTALRTTRAGGRVVLAGMPTGRVDLAPVWFRELELVGSYATATENVDGDAAMSVTNGKDAGSSFALALELAGRAPLSEVALATYPLARWRDALGHAMDAGRLGTAKVAFDLSGGDVRRPQ